MEQDARQVVSGGIETEERDIGQVRDPGQGVPVGAVGGDEGPAQASRSQPPGNVGVSADVRRVVEGDEIEAERGREQGDRTEGQQQRGKRG